MRVPRSLRNAFLSVMTLIVLFGAAGVAYTLLAGGSGPKQASSSKAGSSGNQTYPGIKPVKPAANAQVGVSVSSLLSPVKAGSNTSVTVQTLPTALCSISVSYAGVASTDSGLAPKKADAYGVTEWSWTVDAGTPGGNWPVKISCMRGGKSGVALASLQVTR